MDTPVTSELTPEQAMAEAFRADVNSENVAAAAPALPVPPSSADSTAPGIDPVTGQAVVPAPTVAAAVPAPVTPSFAPYEIEWRGQKVVVDSLEKAIEYSQKGYDYTQKTQTVAEERRQVQELARAIADARQRERAEQALIWNSAEALRQRLAALTGSVASPFTPAAQTTPSQPDPDDFVTTKQVQQDLYALRAQIVAETRRDINAELDRVEQARLETSYRTDFDSTVHAIIESQFPQLKDVYEPAEAERLMKAEAQSLLRSHMTLNPGVAMDPRVLKNAMTEWASRRAARFDSVFKQKEKDEAVRRATAVAAAPEPPGGGIPPQPGAQTYKSFKDPNLIRSAVDDVEAIIRGIIK